MTEVKNLQQIADDLGDRLERHRFGNISLKTNDVLRLELGNGIVNAWEIQGFYYGGVGQEGVIEITPMGINPPEAPGRFEPPYDKRINMFVPANLIHRALETGLLEIYRPAKRVEMDLT